MFEFVNGWLALGTLGGSIPIIIHLLNRRRFKIVRWAAMEFLLASLRKNYKRIRMENILLLVLRVLLIVLVALALARPRLVESGILGALGTANRHVILVVDESFSMGYREGSATCFSKAKDGALRVLASLDRGDMVSVIGMSDTVRPVVKEATLDLDLVRGEVSRMEAGWGGTDVRRALLETAGLLDSTRQPKKEIYIFTDMQAAGWSRKGQAADADLKAAVEKIRREAAVFLVDVGMEQPDNAAVTRLAPRAKVVGTGAPTEFEADVTNFGRTRKPGLQVAFLVDRFGQDSKTVDLEPGQTETVSFSHSFRSKGSSVVQVQLGDDRLRADNVRYLAARVEDAVPVLLVNGEASQELDRNETYYLERALKPPSGESAVRLSNIEPVVITEFGLSSADFGRYRLVVLANLASFAAESVLPRLDDYVRQGGALVVFLGNRIDAAFYNEQLFKAGKGLLPAALGAEVSAGGEEGGGAHLEVAKPVYPAFEFFTGEKAIHIHRALFSKFFDLRLPNEKEDIRVVARFDTGGAAVVEKVVGRGRVLLFASSCDTEWNTFAKFPAYPVVMQDLVSYLASGDLWQRNVLVHQPYRQVFGPEELVESVTVRPPGDGAAPKRLTPYPVRSAAAAAKPGGDGAAASPVVEIAYDETNAAGPYEMEFQTKDGSKRAAEYFAVNVPPEESELRRCTPEEARAAVPGLDFKYMKALGEVGTSAQAGRAGRDFSRALLLAALLLACVELVLAQRFGR